MRKVIRNDARRANKTPRDEFVMIQGKLASLWGGTNPHGPAVRGLNPNPIWGFRSKSCSGI